MILKPKALGLFAAVCLVGLSQPYNCANASSFFFSTGDPDGKMAAASRPSSAGKIEIETADDFAIKTATQLTSATFTGLLPLGLNLTDIMDVRVEIYRVFPTDSDVGRTPNVPTRVNSPSDVE